MSSSALSGTLPLPIPGGSNKQVQFNDSGVLAGDAKLTWDKALGSLINSGILDLNSGKLRVPIGTGALSTTEGYAQWQSTLKQLLLYDGARELSLSSVGWTPRAVPIGYDNTTGNNTAVALAANGGSVAMFLLVPAHMLVQRVVVFNTDSTLARTWAWDIYIDDVNNSNTLRRVVASNGSDTFTAVGPTSHILDASGAPVYLSPGGYWLVIQNRHASNTFGIGSQASSANYAFQLTQTKTTTNPNGATLDLVAATWTKVTTVFSARVDGRVFGQTTPF